ncbi:MAG: hypothetical protein H3C34_29300 [Caldilineaceae bacterium]|nr:hypothetical protein [Caldilineaceae bacterium]
MAFAGIDQVRAKTPVFPGDTITATAVVGALRRTSDGRRAILTLEITVTKQTGETVMTFTYALMIRAAGQSNEEEE